MTKPQAVEAASVTNEELLDAIIANTKRQKPSRYEKFNGSASLMDDAKKIATELQDIVTKRELYSKIGKSVHVHYEGWCALGAMVGVTVRTVWCRPDKDDEGNYIAEDAQVEVIDVETGAVIGRAESRCDADEISVRTSDGSLYNRWLDARGKPMRYAIKSMAQTRAGSRALASVLRWITVMAGYSGTPAEEAELGRDREGEEPAEKLITEPQKRRLYARAVARAKAIGWVPAQAGDLEAFACEDLGIDRKAIPSARYDELVAYVDSYTQKPLEKKASAEVQTSTETQEGAAQ